MRIVNIDEFLTDVDTDAEKLIIIYLSNVFTSSVNKISDRIGWSIKKTRTVCESLKQEGVVTELQSKDAYALSRAVIR